MHGTNHEIPNNRPIDGRIFKLAIKEAQDRVETVGIVSGGLENLLAEMDDVWYALTDEEQAWLDTQ